MDKTTTHWNGKPLQMMDDVQVIIMLRGFQKLGEIKRQTALNAYNDYLAECSPLIRQSITLERDHIRHHQDWRDYITEPLFEELEKEADRRSLEWDVGITLHDQIDLSNRGPLERQLVGAIRDTINAHGPITKEIANSAAKRMIGAIKTYNKKAR